MSSKMQTAQQAEPEKRRNARCFEYLSLRKFSWRQARADNRMLPLVIPVFDVSSGDNRTVRKKFNAWIAAIPSCVVVQQLDAICSFRIAQILPLAATNEI